jgi:hypothetical protein
MTSLRETLEDDDVFESPEERAPMPVVIKTPKQTQLERIRAIEDSIYQQSASVVFGALRFADLTPESEEPPQSWVDELGKEEAWRQFRSARYATMPGKDAPEGIKVASTVFAAITKARAAEKGGPRNLNVAFVQMSAPLPQFPVVEVEHKK